MPSLESGLRVRKETIEVELVLSGAAPRRVEMFLAEHGSHGFSRESVLELLENGGCFLPVRDVESGTWEVINSRIFVWLEMSRNSADSDDMDIDLYDHRRLVRVTLLGGVTLEGEILYSAPEGSARVLDVMNRRERILRLWSGDRVFLLNKEFVLRVVEGTVPREESACR